MTLNFRMLFQLYSIKCIVKSFIVFRSLNPCHCLTSYAFNSNSHCSSTLRLLSGAAAGGALGDGNGLASGGGHSGPAHSTITISDSKQNFKDLCTPSSATTTLLGPGTGMQQQQLTPNHLDVPAQGNPNLLSPDVLSQRRGKFCFYLT